MNAGAVYDAGDVPVSENLFEMSDVWSENSNMVSWIYSGSLFSEILCGVTTTDQNGRMAVKMVPASRIQK